MIRDLGRPGKIKVTSLEAKIAFPELTVEKKQSCNLETCSRTNFRSLARFQTLKATSRHIWKVHLDVFLFLFLVGYKMGPICPRFFYLEPRCLPLSDLRVPSFFIGPKVQLRPLSRFGLDLIALHFRGPKLAARYKIRGLQKWDYPGLGASLQAKSRRSCLANAFFCP